MSTSFDLNINSYTIKELEEVFELPKNYDESMVETQEIKLRQNIINDRGIPSSTKNNTLEFISKVKKTLLENLKKNNMPSQNLNKLAKTYQDVYNIDKSLNKSDLIDAGSTYIIKQTFTFT